jgi:hypothetical protein
VFEGDTRREASYGGRPRAGALPYSGSHGFGARARAQATPGGPRPIRAESSRLPPRSEARPPIGVRAAGASRSASPGLESTNVETAALVPGERKRIYTAATALGLGLAALVVGGAGAWRGARVVEAERIVLRDAQGRIRAELSAAPNGTAKLALLDEQGRDRVALRAAPGDDAALDLYERGRLRVSIAAESGGRAALRLFDARRPGEASLFLGPDSTAGLELSTRGRRVHLAAQPDGLGGLAISDPDGRLHAKLGALPDDLRLQPTPTLLGQPPFSTHGPEAARAAVVPRASSARPGPGRAPMPAAPEQP